MVLENWIAMCKRVKLDHQPTPYRKVNLKQTKNVDIRTKTSELLEENIEGKFFDIGLSDEFLDFKPKIKTTKLKISK